MTHAPTSTSLTTPQTRPLWRRVVDPALSLGVALLVAVVLRATLFQPFTIPSSSMEPGLVTGDYILVSKFAYGWSRASLPFDPPLPPGRLFGHAPARGDVVVFRLPRDPRQTYIKRVIGLPGDRVQVSGGRLIVNGQPLATAVLDVTRDHDDPDRTVRLVSETQDRHTRLIYGGAPGHEGDETGVYVVPPGHDFVMGDNRDNSVDSRWPSDVGVGLLPEDNLVGKAEIIAASWRPGASLFKPWTWLNLQWSRLLHPIR